MHTNIQLLLVLALLGTTFTRILTETNNIDNQEPDSSNPTLSNENKGLNEVSKDVAQNTGKSAGEGLLLAYSIILWSLY